MSTHPTPIIRPAAAEDLEEMVRVHLRAFPGFFLAQAGPRFIRAYYRAVLEYASGIALVAPAAEGGSGLAGFVTGFADPGRFYSIYRKRRVRLLTALIPGLVRRPWLLIRALGNARRIAREEGMADSVELSSIGVDPACGRHGIGSALMRAFLTEAAGQRARYVVLTTDARDNDAVNDFYRREGFRVDQLLRHGRREMVLYRMDLPPADLPVATPSRGACGR